MDIQSYLPQLVEILVERGAVLAYLFGSQAEGTAGPLSDVDIAVLPARRVSDRQGTE